MLLSVDIRNFQSVENVRISLDAPVVLFTGSSDSGKSAILRAINDAVFRGVGGTYFRVRPDGKRAASMFVLLTARRPNGDVATVQWDKTKKNATYTVTGTVYDNCGKVVPDAVTKELGLSSEADLGEVLHYRSQHHRPFMLDDRGPKDAYRFLSTILGADVVIQVLNAVESKRRKIADETGYADTDLIEAQRKLSDFHSQEDLDRAAELLRSAEAQSTLAETLGGRLEVLAGFHNKLEAVEQKDASIVKAQTIMGRLEASFSLATISSNTYDKLSARSTEAQLLSGQFDKLAALGVSAAALDSINTADLSPLQVLQEKLAGLVLRHAAALAIQSKQDELAEKKIPEGVEEVTAKIDDGLATAKVRVERINTAQAIVDKNTLITALDSEEKRLKDAMVGWDEELTSVKKLVGCGGDLSLCPFLNGEKK